MSKRYKYSSWKGGSICLESIAESREYMLTYFLGMGTFFFIGGMETYIYWGGWVEIFCEESPHPPWICTPDMNHMIVDSGLLKYLRWNVKFSRGYNFFTQILLF